MALLRFATLKKLDSKRFLNSTFETISFDFVVNTFAF